jgi:hypothetical protein
MMGYTSLHLHISLLVSLLAAGDRMQEGTAGAVSSYETAVAGTRDLLLRLASQAMWGVLLQVDASRVRCGHKGRGYTVDEAAGLVTVHFKDKPDIK